MNNSGVSLEQADSGTLPALPTEEFVQEFTRAQRTLYLHILAMVGKPLDAEEILQETNVVIWAKFQQFELGTNFLAWARQIANYEVLKFREKRHRDRRVFSSEFIEMVAAASSENTERQEQRRLALFECMKKLSTPDRELIQLRYAPGASGKSVAEEIGRPANSVYQSLGRIRRALMDCVQRRMTTEGQTS